jgi:PAS domain S-box-containing protein
MTGNGHNRESLWTAECFEDSPTLRQDFDGSPEGIYFVDPECRITFWNRAAERLTGFLTQDVLGRRCSEYDLLVHCDDSGTILCHTACPLRATVSDGICREVRVHLRHHRGYRLPVRLRSVVLRDQAGQTIGAVEVFALPVSKSVQDADRQTYPASVLKVLDIEGIRHRYGFDGTAHICRGVERSLRGELDSASSLCRLNTHTFVAIFGGLDAQNPAETLRRIREVGQHVDTLWWGDPVDVRLSAAYTWLSFGDDLDKRITSMAAQMES